MNPLLASIHRTRHTMHVIRSRRDHFLCGVKCRVRAITARGLSVPEMSRTAREDLFRKWLKYLDDVSFVVGESLHVFRHRTVGITIERGLGRYRLSEGLPAEHIQGVGTSETLAKRISSRSLRSKLGFGVLPIKKNGSRVIASLKPMISGSRIRSRIT